MREDEAEDVQGFGPMLADIHRKLVELEKSSKLTAEAVAKIEALENAELEYMNVLKGMEARELSNLDQIESMENKELTEFNKISVKKYTDIMSWKTAIWEHCPQKVLIDSKKMVLFNCALTGKVCSFENCPRNVQGHQEK